MITTKVAVIGMSQEPDVRFWIEDKGDETWLCILLPKLQEPKNGVTLVCLPVNRDELIELKEVIGEGIDNIDYTDLVAEPQVVNEDKKEDR